MPSLLQDRPGPGEPPSLFLQHHLELRNAGGTIDCTTEAL